MKINTNKKINIEAVFGPSSEIVVHNKHQTRRLRYFDLNKAYKCTATLIYIDSKKDTDLLSKPILTNINAQINVNIAYLYKLSPALFICEQYITVDFYSETVKGTFEYVYCYNLSYQLNTYI